MRFLMLSLGVVIGVGALAAACGGSDETEPFCESGAFVFCRCQNGDPGTKECNSDGTSFAACMAETGGECPEGDDDSSGDPTSSGDPSGPGSGGSGGGSGDGELYAACDGGEQCQSGTCAADGFCTQQCGSFMDCLPGDCPGISEPADIAQICVPTCGYFDETTNMPVPDAAACDDYGLYCGYAKASDGFPILVCSSWETGIPVPPEGTECDYERFGSTQCNLGYQGADTVCSAFGVCVANACYEDSDCQDGSCSKNDGSMGTCN